MIAIDPNGDFVIVNGKLTEAINPPWQNYMSEARCLQGTWSPDLTFGRNPIIWELGNVGNRIDDLTRIGIKYVVVQSVTFDSTFKRYNIT